MKLVLAAVLALATTAAAQERYLVFKKGQGTWIDAKGKNPQAVGTRLVPGALLSPNAGAWAGVTDGRLWVTNPQGKAKRELATGVAGAPRWTPDSTGLVFAAGNDIHVVDVNTKTTRRLTKSRAPLTRPALDASGHWLVYMHGKNLVLKHLVTHEESVLVRNAADAVYAWSTQAGELAWADARGLHLWNVFTQKLARRASPVPLAEIRELSWTPSGGAVGMRHGRTLHVVDKKLSARAITLPKDAEPAPVRWQLLIFDG